MDMAHGHYYCLSVTVLAYYPARTLHRQDGRQAVPAFGVSAAAVTMRDDSVHPPARGPCPK
eukprot:364796-Chlamydomonas_euryale.AAC.6